MAGPGRSRRRPLQITSAPPAVPSEVPPVESQATDSSVNEVDSAINTPPTGPHSSAASSSCPHKKHGQARGLAVERETHGGRKILGLRFFHNHLRSLGIKGKHFTRELGSITRAEVSPHIINVKKIVEDDWAKIKLKIVGTFDVDINDETVQDCIYCIVMRAHKTWRYSTKQHFLEKRDVSFEEALQNPPDDVDVVDWRVLCDKYENDKAYQNQMMELQAQSSTDGATQFSTNEIYDKVMGTRQGYVKGLGHGIRPTSSSSSRQSSQETLAELEAQIREEARVEQAALEARIREDARVEQATLEARMQEEARLIREEARVEQATLEARMQEEKETFEAQLKALEELVARHI